MTKIFPCLSFGQLADDASQFYLKVFPRSKILHHAKVGQATAAASGLKEGSTLVVFLEIDGFEVMALNHGPDVSFSPSQSLYVSVKDESRLRELWAALSTGGSPRMPLDSYPWSKLYGWTADKFGVEWQLILGDSDEIAPAQLFVDERFGQAQAAIDFYSKVLLQSKVLSHTPGAKAGSTMFALVEFLGQKFTFMDGEGVHNHKPTLAYSLVVGCDTQDEIDRYWSGLSEGGETSQCGWLTDKFGVTWQVCPTQTPQWISDPKKGPAVMNEVIQMEKLDLARMKAAYDKA